MSCFTKKCLYVSIFACGLFFLSLFLLIFFFFELPQERGAAHFAVVWVIVSPTVQSWRPCRPNRSPTSDGKTTWLIVQWTSKVFFYCGGRSILALWLSHPTCTSRSQRAAGAYFREILKCWANPRNFLGNCKCHQTKEVYFYCQLRTMDCFKKKTCSASHLSFVCLTFCNILILTVNKTSGCETFFFSPSEGRVSKPLVQSRGTEGGDSTCVLVSHRKLLVFGRERLQNESCLWRKGNSYYFCHLAGAVWSSLRAERWTTVKVWPERAVHMDVILKEGLLYLQGVKFFKVCWREEMKVIVP